MDDQVTGRDVIDIDCGSGILSLVAKKRGARKVIGIDIDPEAIEHSKLNARFNQLDIDFGTDLSEALTRAQNPLILMNMIEQDQASVWPLLAGYTDEMIVSGIMVERKEGYLLKRTELQHSRELQLDNWIGLHHFHTAHSRRHAAHSSVHRRGV